MFTTALSIIGAPPISKAGSVNALCRSTTRIAGLSPNPTSFWPYVAYCLAWPTILSVILGFSVRVDLRRRNLFCCKTVATIYKHRGLKSKPLADQLSSYLTMFFRRDANCPFRGYSLHLCVARKNVHSPTQINILDAGVAKQLLKALLLTDAALFPATIGSTQVASRGIDPNISSLNPFRRLHGLL